jgi:hypothetical protein
MEPPSKVGTGGFACSALLESNLGRIVTGFVLSARSGPCAGKNAQDRGGDLPSRRAGSRRSSPLRGIERRQSTAVAGNIAIAGLEKFNVADTLISRGAAAWRRRSADTVDGVLRQRWPLAGTEGDRSRAVSFATGCSRG